MLRLRLLTGICLLLAQAAFSQTVARKPLPTGPLEKYDNPPAIAAPILVISPALVSQFGPYTSYQVNVDANGNNIIGDAANEPSICVDPNDRNKMSIGWRQFDNVTSNFREAGFAYTTNGGTRWTAPGVLQNNVFRSDPVLNSDTGGRFFYLSLLQNFFVDLWRSITGGQTWTMVAPADGGDKQWFTIDNTNSPGHGFQYQCWSTDGNNFGGRQFTRSTNSGLTWMNPINIPNSPRWGTLDVDSNGNLFIGGVNLDTGQIWCVRSSNAKNGAVVPTFDQSTAVNLGGEIVSGEPINPEGLVGQVFLAVDRSGMSTNNNIYILASVQPTGFSTGSDVMFTRSTDGGRTFNAPRRINNDPINHAKWHWFGTLSVAPNGRIDVVWYDSRNAADNVTSQLFYSFSTDGGNTWSSNVAISNPFNPFIGYPNQQKIGDYITVVSDNTSPNIAYAATFNGEEDIYYVRPSAALAPASLGNISTRSFVQTGEHVMIGGFIVQGTGRKRVIIRAIGPELTQFGINDALANPRLELHNGAGALIATNDDWQTTIIGGIINANQVSAIQSSGRAPTAASESAIVADLLPGNYTAIVRGVNNTTGVALVEVYDLSPAASSSLANISTRSFVQTADHVMIGGFIVQGNGRKRVIIRAIGPELTQFGINDALANPRLELHNGAGALIATNDNWQMTILGGIITANQVSDIQNSGHAPTAASESAIIANLLPGNYTAIVRGVSNTTGVALVEIYDLD
ncbi:MAG: sialidase family protein [Nitrospirota bacterium]